MKRPQFSEQRIAYILRQAEEGTRVEEVRLSTTPGQVRRDPRPGPMGRPDFTAAGPP